MTKSLKAFDHPERQQYRAYINTYVNPVHAWPRPEVMCEKFLKKLDLIVALEFRHTDTTAWADYILPECTQFEHEELYANSDCIVLQQPAIEPMGESRTASENYALLAKGMGVGEYFEGMTDEDWTRLRLASGDPQLNGPEPITYEALKEKHVMPMYGATGETDIYSKTDWQYDTQTGRHEFYCEDLYEVGAAFGTYTPSRLDEASEEMKEKYPLHMYPGRHRVFMQTQFTEFEEPSRYRRRQASRFLEPCHRKGIGNQGRRPHRGLQLSRKHEVRGNPDRGIPSGYGACVVCLS